MKTISRRALGAVALALAPAAVVAGLAWACTPQAQYTEFFPSSGPPGTLVKVAGAQFTAEPITIHWGSATGPVLATATGPEFAVTVTVPVSPDDTYAIVAVARGSNGSQSGQASRAFTLDATPPQGGGSTSATTSGAQGSPSTATAQGSTPARQASGASAAPSSGSTSATVRARAERAEASAPASRAAPRRTADGVTGAQAPALATPAEPATAPRDAPTAAAPQRDRAAARNTAEAATFGAPVPARPSESTAGSELWSAFGSGDRSAPTNGAQAAAVQTSISDSPATIGIALLALGLVGLMGGVAIAATRRRRAGARSRSEG